VFPWRFARSPLPPPTANSPARLSPRLTVDLWPITAKTRQPPRCLLLAPSAATRGRITGRGCVPLATNESAVKESRSASSAGATKRAPGTSAVGAAGTGRGSTDTATPISWRRAVSVAVKQTPAGPAIASPTPAFTTVCGEPEERRVPTLASIAAGRRLSGLTVTPTRSRVEISGTDCFHSTSADTSRSVSRATGRQIGAGGPNR